jgi:excisionase family DNA binding protein
MTEHYLTVAECAALLSVDHKTIRRLVERGELPALRPGYALEHRPRPADRPGRPRGAALSARPVRAWEPRTAPAAGPGGDFSRLARDP